MPATQRSTKSHPRKPGSQSALRHLNQQRIIECLLSGPSTQAELSRQTGLSTATVSNIVKIMQDAGLVSTEPTTSSGRRATNVRLNSNAWISRENSSASAKRPCSRLALGITCRHVEEAKHRDISNAV